MMSERRSRRDQRETNDGMCQLNKQETNEYYENRPRTRAESNTTSVVHSKGFGSHNTDVGPHMNDFDNHKVLGRHMNN